MVQNARIARAIANMLVIQNTCLWWVGLGRATDAIGDTRGIHPIRKSDVNDDNRG